LKATAEKNQQRPVMGNYREGNYNINSYNWHKNSSARCALVNELLSDEIPPPVGIQHSA